MRLSRGFDRLSPIWDLAVRLVPRTAIPRSRIRHLARACDCRRALIVGGGTGEFLQAVLASGFAGSILYLDVSPAMLRRARLGIARRFPEALNRVEFRRGDLFEDLPCEKFDLVCTHYFLDMFRQEELSRAMRMLDERLAQNGVWLFSDFAQPSGGAVRRALHGAFLRVLYVFFGWTCGIEIRTLPAIEDEFPRMGYVPLEQAEHCTGLLHSAAYQREAIPGHAVLDPRDRVRDAPGEGISCHSGTALCGQRFEFQEIDGSHEVLTVDGVGEVLR